MLVELGSGIGFVGETEVGNRRTHQRKVNLRLVELLTQGAVLDVIEAQSRLIFQLPMLKTQPSTAWA